MSSSNHNSDSLDRLRWAERRTRHLARGHYENFLVASVLLPRAFRQPFYNVYAFCRIADDAADQSRSAQEALDSLERIEHELDRALTGDADQFWSIALANTISRFALDTQPFRDLLSAFRQDQHRHHYDDMDQVIEYCRYSANPVGRIVLQLCGHLSVDRAALSDHICTGLQLANFLQDVGRDRRMGRIYLPADQMRRFGVTEEMLDASESTPELKRLLASECLRAAEYFQLGWELTEQVPRWLARNVALFVGGGMAALKAIERNDFDVLKSRPLVRKRTHAWLILRAWLGQSECPKLACRARSADPNTTER